MGVTLMPWQIRALCGQLSTDDDGQLMFRKALVSTARQNGKSIALQALIGWWVTEYAAMLGRPQNVLSVANRLDRAEGIFAGLAPKLVELFDAKKIEALGRKSVKFADGSIWEIRAASKRLHGGSYDLIVIDEAFDVSPEVVSEALEPSQIARPNPLMSVWSTAGDEESKFLSGMREACLAELDAGVTGLTYFAEWSLPPGANPRDESLWGYPNPSLGTTITVSALRAAQNNPSYLRSHMNLWVSARGAWLPADAWSGLADDTALPAGGFLAVETSLDDTRYFAVRAAADGGVVRVELAFTAQTENETWERICALMTDPKMMLVVPPNLEIHVPTSLRTRTQIAGYKEILKYTTTIRAMILEGKLRHRNSNVLNEHVNRAVLSKTGEGVTVSSQKSPGPIEACRAMIWATALASRPTNKAKPLLVVSR
jgi:phage terminase large subunit-like protein